MLDDLVEGGFPLKQAPGRLAVPEPLVKRALASLGAAVPRHAVVASAAQAPVAAASLREPLVVKAFGPGILHKTELGAIRLDVSRVTVGAEIQAIQATFEDNGRDGATPRGFLIEEQQPAGVELLVGVVRRDPVGLLAMVGLGGTLAELLDDVSVRLCPLSRSEAEALLQEFRGASVLDGFRGRPPVDRDALVDVIMRVAGPDGLAVRLGANLAELECNPVIGSPAGAVVADARLVVLTSPDPAEPAPSVPPPFDRLFAPRSVAIAGASTSRVTFGNRALTAYKSVGWTEGLWALHPTATTVEGVPARPSIADLPGGMVDYLQVAVPAQSAIGLVREEGRRAGVVQVISGGFGEAGPDGRRLEAELLQAAKDAGVRLLGPNCMGVYAPAGRQTYLQGVPLQAGPVGVVSQSGGLGGDVINYGARRGLRFSKLVSIGNAIDVSVPEVLEHLLDDQQTEVVGLYLEGLRDGRRVVQALRNGRGRVPVVVLAGGSSEQGRDAVATHTGSLAADQRMWDAVAASTGATMVATLEDFVGCLLHHQSFRAHPAPGDPDTLVIGIGGGASVLAADACGRAGLAVTGVAPETRAQLVAMGYGVGTSVANPIEAVASTETLGDMLEAVLSVQAFPDVLVHVNVQAYFGYGTAGVRPLLDLLEMLGGSELSARSVVVARNLDVAPGPQLEAVFTAAERCGIPLYRTFDEATLAIAAGKRFARHKDQEKGVTE